MKKILIAAIAGLFSSAFATPAMAERAQVLPLRRKGEDENFSMDSKLWTPTGRIKTEPRPELQNLKPPRMPELEPERRYAKPPIKSYSVPDKSTVKSQRQAKAKRKAKRGF